MPTVTTTVTSACATGVTTTVTTTEATPEPDPVVVAAAPAADATPEKVDGHCDSTDGVHIPEKEEEITAEWLTAALHSRGTISKRVTVASIEPIVNIGAGRGYANLSFKIVCAYDQPVSPDTPTKFVFKMLNRPFMMGVIGAIADGAALPMFDKSFMLEPWFYDNIRDLMPVPQPKCYWTGAKTLPGGIGSEKDIGSYGTLMEWLGDDLKKVECLEGMTDVENIQAMDAISKVHRRFWNQEWLAGCKPIFTGPEMTELWITMMFEEEKKPLIVDYIDELHASKVWGKPLAEMAKRALKSDMRSWMYVGATGDKNKVLTTADLRTENMVWRKTATDYECVLLDHQVWMYGGAPMRDVIVHYAFSSKASDMKKQVTAGLEHYYATLTEGPGGVTTYSHEDMLADVRRSCWFGVLFAIAGATWIPLMKGFADDAAPGEAKEAATLQYVTLKAKLEELAVRGAVLIDHFNAMENPPF